MRSIGGKRQANTGADCAMVVERRARHGGQREINGINSEIDGIKNKINPINFRFNPINFFFNPINFATLPYLPATVAIVCSAISPANILRHRIKRPSPAIWP